MSSGEEHQKLPEFSAPTTGATLREKKRHGPVCLRLHYSPTEYGNSTPQNYGQEIPSDSPDTPPPLSSRQALRGEGEEEAAAGATNKVGAATFIFVVLVSVGGGLCQGAAVSIAATLNPYTGHGIRSALVNFTEATIIYGCLILCFREWRVVPSWSQLKAEGLQWWTVPIPGFAGSTQVAMTVIVLGYLSFGTFSAFAVTGQLIASFAVEHYALFGVIKREPFNMYKLMCIVIVLSGAVCVVGFGSLSNTAAGDSSGQKEERSTFQSILLCGISLFTGFFFPLQASYNGRARQLFRSPIVSSFLSFLFGTILLSIGTAFSFLFVKSSALKLGDSHWYNYIGGIPSVGYIFTTSFSPPVLGTGLFIVCVIFGQFSGALSLDLGKYLPGARVREVDALRAIGLAVIFIGVCIIQFIKFLSMHQIHSWEELKNYWNSNNNNASSSSLSNNDGDGGGSSPPPSSNEERENGAEGFEGSFHVHRGGGIQVLEAAGSNDTVMTRRHPAGILYSAGTTNVVNHEPVEK